MLISHRNQINEQKKNSLIDAGIGVGYHTRVLSSIAGTEPMCEWVRSQARQDLLTDGKGWTVIGAGYEAHDVCILLARALHLSQIRCKVLPLVKLARIVDAEGEEFDYLSSCNGLFILDFYQIYKADTNVLTGWQVASIESFLNHRLDNNLGVFVHMASDDVGKAWWSSGFLQRVANKNRRLEVRS